MQQQEGMRLSIEVGTPLTLEVEGIEARINCNLIGIKPDHYLIVDIPPSGIGAELFEAGQITVRYLFFGNIYGFRTIVLKAITEPSRLMFLSYPESVASHNLRNKDRVRCYIPAKAVVYETELKGVILDLSSDGCKFAMIVSENEAALVIARGDEITLFLPLLGKEGTVTFQAVVRHVINDDERIIFGVQFEQILDEVRAEIDEYIDKVKRFI